MSIYSHQTLQAFYDKARKDLDHAAAMRHVAGLTGQDIETIESVLASSEAGEEVEAV